MTSQELRQKFLDFFKLKGHVIIPSSSLVPENDPSVLLTTAGMQQFKPYYTGAADPLKDNHLSLGKPLGSKNVASIQKSFRTSDIDEVGDDTHLTFFEMLGNFSFGGYGKKEAIEYAHEFITKTLCLKIDYVSAFGGEAGVPLDNESEKIWENIDPSIKIKKAGRADNFWGPTGDQGPCGPTTEIYVNGLEIWNIVFNEFYQNPDKTLTKLDNLGIDTGMGLERLAAVVQKTKTVYETDLFAPILAKLPDNLRVKDRRVLADHLRAICFLVSDGLTPSNKEAGYVLRRLMRGIMDSKDIDIKKVFKVIVNNYRPAYPELNDVLIMSEYDKERQEYLKGYERGQNEVMRLKNASIGKPMITGYDAFNISSSFGTRVKDILDISTELNVSPSPAFDEELEAANKKHKELSKTASAGMFKGGLVDHQPQTIRHHTAHHLLLAALRQVLGSHIFQRGSNVSSERLRIDFSHPAKVTSEQLKQVEAIVNQAIAEDLEVKREEMPKVEAEKLGALAEFGAKYGEVVSVYTIFNKDGSVFSREFCGGPHVKYTGQIGNFKITKEEGVAAGIRRIKAMAGK